VPTLAALRATIAAARSDIAACEAILATGDLVQDDPDGYAHFRAEFSVLGKPVRPPGNHDDVPAMRAALAGDPFQLDGGLIVGTGAVLLTAPSPARPAARSVPSCSSLSASC
jgi:3',5'-cyclic AMP phosphodiesterase CpdA